MNLHHTQAAPVALITGAARRIGAAIAQHLHQNHYNIIIQCHQSVDAAKALAQSLNEQRADGVLVLDVALSDKNALKRMMDDALSWQGRLDVLVNNAATFESTPLDAAFDAPWDDLFCINVQVPFWLSCLARPYLEMTKGSIINITDIHAEKPLKNYSLYCQSKAALTMQTLSLAREFAPNIRVNAIAPGAILWPEHQNKLLSSQQNAIIAHTLLKQHGDPFWIAQAVLALLQNKFITGQILKVDGGRF